MLFQTRYLILVLSFLQHSLLTSAEKGKKEKANPEENKDQEDSSKRHVIEAGVKPAIFGSHSYDPIRQVFDTPLKEAKATTKGDGAIPETSTGAITVSPIQDTTAAHPEETKPEVTTVETETTKDDRKQFVSADDPTTTESTSTSTTITPVPTIDITTVDSTVDSNHSNETTKPAETEEAWWSRLKLRAQANNDLKGMGLRIL